MSAVHRTSPPDLGRPPEVRLPPVTRRSMFEGLDLVTLPVPGPPLVVVEAVIDAGSVHDPPGTAGLADLTAHLLPEGAAGLGMLEIAQRLAELGGHLSVGTGHDAAWIRIVVLASNLEPAVELLADLLVRPSFPAEEVERLLAEREIDLVRERDDPGIVASRTFAEELYGVDHPYGQPTSGTLGSVRGLTRQTFQAFYRRRYVPAGGALLAVGPFEPDRVHSAVERAFTGWAGEIAPRADVRPPERPGRGVVLVDRPGSAQSELRVGHLGVPRDHPDHVPLTALDHLLGGSFHSRLNLNLRERRGWTYGVRSRFSFRRGPGPFIVATPVEGPATRAALEEIAGEIARTAAGPIQSEERELAVNGITRSLPRLFETPARIAERVREIVVYDLPDDHFAGYQDRFRAVTVEDLERTAAEHLHPERLMAVVVGDGEAVADELAEVEGFETPLRHRAWKPPEPG
ncbi:MAG: insulinase family protein [Gemmatimonadetes bacterium]|nr:insulinase family protein [Gemmatimonadota bacterium]